MWLYYFPWRKHHDFKKAKLKIDNENLENRNQILLSRLRLCQKANRSKHLLTSENVSKEYTFENYRGSKRDHKSIITNNNRIEPTKITEVMSKTDEEFECVSNGSFNVNEISYDNISDDELTDPISNFNIGSALKPDQHSSNNNEFKLETIKRDD